MVIFREIDGGIITDDHVILHRLEGNTVIDVAAGHRVHVLEIEAQLVHRAQAQRGYGHLVLAVQ